MKLIFIKAQALFSLGLVNSIQILIYRIYKKLGFFIELQSTCLSGIFFHEIELTCSEQISVKNWLDEVRYFGYTPVPVLDIPPDWHLNPLTGTRSQSSRQWWRIPDFDPSVGDIKIFWEASRFDWVLSFAQRAKLGDKKSLEKLNFWLNDWCENNPSYRGVNWKCGQEAAIRVMHLAMAAVILGQANQPSSVLLELIVLHLERIESTLNYAMAQDNNHGTSEAAALFIGGSWAKAQGNKYGEKWSRLGRKWLENRVSHLIDTDGSFSQYSLNYHRVVLDTLSMVEIWRRYFSLPAFSKKWQLRASAAAYWLANMIHPSTGDGPNIGANDGACFLPLTDTDYRDYRPSVQLAMTLFNNKRAYFEEGVWDLPLKWLNIKPAAEVMEKPNSTLFDKGGYAVMRHANAWVLLRYPRFRFRPSQADALHLDLWINDENILRDGGSYSYNAEPEWLAYFHGVSSHNTIQFDGRDQMPRLSRFLFGNWLKIKSICELQKTEDTVSFGASYRDSYGAIHARFVELTENNLTVCDEIKGFSNSAIMRWRLKPGNWCIEGNSLTNGLQTIRVNTAIPIKRFELVDGWESRYYLQKNQLPVLEVEVEQPGVLVTEYNW
ncbi:heparinase II/III family protein [Legionella brunensis]|uniref:Heparinase II/III-like protein n=1 Tax=Legionella brunensis TaxID=29422 RepID=A0A0W0SE98_9GAMM|nr:heparinase II/III-family protein [Legionella brunensis]KTC81428.1 Heparinase II/III-like protein [Legionella brunensis]